MARVSVLMPVYNGERFLRESVESVLSQTFGDFEFLIVNDGSTDRTAEILAGFRDERLKITHNAKNIGRQRSLNLAIRLSGAEYLARLDADDVCHPKRFELQVAFLDAHPNVAVLGTAASWLYDDGHQYLANYPTDEVSTHWGLLFAWGILHPTVMMRRSVIVSAGGYSESPNCAIVDDLELWSRIVPQHRIVNLPDRLLTYRVHSGSETAIQTVRHAQQLEAHSVANILRVLGPSHGRDSAILLRRFIVSPPGAPQSFRRDEADLLARAFEDLQGGFYREINGTAGKWQHRLRVSYKWAKHAAALSLKTSGEAAARWRLARWSAQLLTRSLGPLPNAS